ncbi:TRAP transporter small permease [Marinobacterium sp. D7]|uniref:TRAP transporter small permease n=1 Tax=Marinobacterium ramblicola TaxID=2849041 RepID=UPI001C2CCD07|nr:TRAP transporter small permease [Marinobacterium ramblicola]MBV1789981.1 TRAP transporter small permease [Marinobacterium ramblicola]
MNVMLGKKGSWLTRGADAVQHLLSGTAALIMLLMMLLTLVDVLGRYLFDAPVTGAFEVTELMLASVIFLGLPLVTAEGGHIVVDILDSALGPRLRLVQQWTVGLINIAAFAVLSWMLWEHAFKVYRYEDTTAVLQIPYAGLAFLIATTSSLATLALLFKQLCRCSADDVSGEQ